MLGEAEVVVEVGGWVVVMVRGTAKSRVEMVWFHENWPLCFCGGTPIFRARESKEALMCGMV